MVGSRSLALDGRGVLVIRATRGGVICNHQMKAPTSGEDFLIV